MRAVLKAKTRRQFFNRRVGARAMAAASVAVLWPRCKSIGRGMMVVVLTMMHSMVVTVILTTMGLIMLMLVTR